MATEVKKSQRKPTPKQIRAVKLTLENIGNSKPKTQEQILLEAGYSKTIAQHMPTFVTNSLGYKELMEKYLPDENIARVHSELLNKREVFHTRKDDGTFESEVIDQPDTQAAKAALDMAYKLKGQYAPERHQSIVAFILPDEKKKSIDDILNENV